MKYYCDRQSNTGFYNSSVKDVERCFSKLNQTALAGFKQLNKKQPVEEKSFTFPAGRLDVWVIRGTALEKAATARIRFRTQNPVTGKDTRFDVLQIKTYPANPKIPILLFNLEYRAAREGGFYGFLDVAPVAAGTADLAFMQGELIRVVSKYAVNYASLRKRVAGIYKMAHGEKPLNAGIGMRLELGAQQADCVQDAASAWLNAYLKIVAEKAEVPYAQKHKDLMYAVRSRIKEFYLRKDLSFKVIQELGVPADVMGRVHFAPVMKC